MLAELRKLRAQSTQNENRLRVRRTRGLPDQTRPGESGHAWAAPTLVQRGPHGTLN